MTKEEKEFEARQEEEWRLRVLRQRAEIYAVNYLDLQKRFRVVQASLSHNEQLQKWYTARLKAYETDAMRAAKAYTACLKEHKINTENAEQARVETSKLIIPPWYDEGSELLAVEQLRTGIQQ